MMSGLASGRARTVTDPIPTLAQKRPRAWSLYRASGAPSTLLGGAHCAIPDKAIYTVEVEIVTRGGERKTVKQPRVDPDKCTGCGVCEHVCPYKDRPGIRVSSANEARNPENQPIAPGDSPY